MKLLEMIKEQLNWKDLSEDEAQQIIDELDSQIDEMRKREEQEEKDSKYEIEQATAKRITEARAKQHSRNNARKKLRHEKNISPARLVRLRKLGKI